VIGYIEVVLMKQASWSWKIMNAHENAGRE
jgi:hypothetical protein